MKTTLILCFTMPLLLIGCSTAPVSPIESKLEKIEKLNLGSTMDQAKSILGKPSETTTKDNVTVWVYNIKHVSKHGISYFPEITLSFDPSGKLVSKDFNLYQEDMAIKASDIIARYKNYPIKKIIELSQPAPCYIQEEGHLIDEKNGFRAEFNTSRNEEVQSIYWYTPEANEKQITPAKN